MTTDKSETQSLAEAFHLVKNLIPEDQEVVTASPDMTVAEAVQLMQRHSFSQLPIVAGDTVLGVFSFRSLATQLLKMGQLTEYFGEFPVGEFMEKFRFVHPSDGWESTLEYLDRDNGVLVGSPDDIQGIVTAMDVLDHLHDLAKAFVLVAEIELSLRRIITACVNGDELQVCIQNSLVNKYEPDELPGQLSEMTFNDYQQIIGDGRNWPYFAPVLGEGEWLRKSTAKRLKEVRDLRNDVFHFKRKLTAENYANLAAHREWLQTKTRAFEARNARKPVAVDQKRKPRSEKWDEPSFFRDLEARCNAQDAAVARRLLEWAQNQGLRIRWGRGKEDGSFFPMFDHGRTEYHTVAVWTYGRIEVQFEMLKRKVPFDSENKRRDLLRRLNAIPGVSLPPDAITRRPSIQLSELRDEAVLEQFLDTLDWIIQEIQAAHSLSQ